MAGWEGDTLVIDSIGFNDKTWIDRAGLPHSDQLHVIERVTRPEHDKLRVDITVDDPKTYTRVVRLSGTRIQNLPGTSPR